MTDAELKEKLMDRFTTANTPFGRWRLGIYVKWKRLAWNLVVGSTRFVKRFLDIVLSIVAIILLIPIFVIIGILVKMDGGPMIFKQTRIGLRGREFKMYKFRSMCMDAEERLAELLKHNEKKEGVTFKMKDDPRITKIGKFIRKASIDELPQFFNVLQGDMSLVGPRPPVPREVALYSQEDRRRFLVKPGITCIWQVGEREGGTFEIGDRNSIDFKEQVSLDVRYIESQSVWKDMWLLAKTVPAILFGKGA